METGVRKLREILSLLQTDAGGREALFTKANDLRKARKGKTDHSFAIIEFSNVCGNTCGYCGLNAGNTDLPRFHMSNDDIVTLAVRLADEGFKNLILQSGEAASPEEDKNIIGKIIKNIKELTPLSVFMSVGNRSKNVYEGWKNNGMDGYLIRFETSDPTLFSKIHPDSLLQDRLDCIRALKELGLKIASGFMIGVPGESLETLSRNILLCKELTLDIVGCGPFIPHPQTAMAQDFNAYRGREEIFLQTIAALRVLNPDADILATPTFDIVMPPDGRKHALQSGANVCPVSKTPEELSEKYDIYPKAITDPEPFESVVRNVKMEERLKRKPTDHIPKNG